MAIHNPHWFKSGVQESLDDETNTREAQDNNVECFKVVLHCRTYSRATKLPIHVSGLWNYRNSSQFTILFGQDSLKICTI